MAFILLAYVPMIISIGGRTIVRLIAKKGVQAMIKKGAKKLTKKNFKKSYEFFRGTKKLKTSDKNKVLENLNIITKKVPKKVIPKKVIPKKAAPKKVTPKEDWLKGIRKNESLEGFLKRKAAAARLKVAPKQVKVPEAGKVKTLIQAAEKGKLPAPISKVKEVLAKGTEVAAPVAKGSTAWDKAKTAMKVAGWSAPVILAGGIFFYSARDKDKDIKKTTDVKVDKGITEAEDITVTKVKPDDTTPAKDSLASKVESLDFDKDVEVITTEHPSVINKTLPKKLPGFTTQRVDTGL
jgi:hypothetical protein